MDFFERQARAARKTRLLILYFVLAVIGIVAILQIVFALLFSRPLNDPVVLVNVSIGVAVVVVIGSAWKIDELSGGGRVVAAMLGGEPVYVNTTDLEERKLVNVVEEMALASGVPVPDIYLLPENTINAFAAGHGPGDTIIGVTRGCIEQLSRDELQGVIAHEFSHILHGDMRLNIRLMGLLAGILGLSVAGTFLMNAVRLTPRSRDSGGGLVAIALAGGFALYVIGWIGVFFGSLIKAAVSRQREFLADASAVQYTRNPQGIAGALWKIGKFQSRLSSPRAHEASHLFFSNGLADSWFALFATHPPLNERIKAIDPGFQPSSVAEIAKTAKVPGQNIAGIGSALLAGLPSFAGESVRSSHSACAFVYSLLLDERDEYRHAQLAGLLVEDSLRQETLALFGRRGEINVAQRLPLVELAIPTLRNLSPSQYSALQSNVRYLIESDREIHLFEFALQKALFRHLELFFTPSTGVQTKYRSVVPLLSEVSILLSGLAYVGSEITSEREATYAAGVRELLIGKSSQNIQRADACDLALIDTALDRIALAAPLVKRRILAACRGAVACNGVVDQTEYELIRAIADSLDCPLPPLAAAAG